MVGDTYLMAINALEGTDDAGVFKASDLMSIEIASGTTVELRFKAYDDTAKNGVVTLTVDTLNNSSGLKFVDVCRVLLGCCNRGKGDVVVLADEVNGEYVEPFKGAVIVDDVN
tara:strand:- start:52 stop:390 length:339 start_codon:yes stop_codon:yes gene_type:complete